ncbi:YdcF family protein [Candidatus Uhrbacteria bacterium]|nr:YdcF family protein [Candidatus Uhrbacteria bacterium]
MKVAWKIVCLASIASIGIILSIVQTGNEPYMYSRGDAPPSNPVALVLGASLRNGKPSVMLADRLDTAAELYNRGIVKKLIVSGDNRREDYNEPEAMRRYLVEKNIPSQDIIPDFAGRRTYDSCYRLKAIFDQTSTLIVTQRFHLPRALYLCKHLDINSIGVIADSSRYNSLAESYIRELFASIKAWLDITILKPTPLLGNKEKVF